MKKHPRSAALWEEQAYVDPDIVSRLRAITERPLGLVIDPPPHPLCQEAANEIERLRQKITEMEMSIPLLVHEVLDL